MSSDSPSKKSEVEDEETIKLIQETINKIKSQGVFDQFRKDCLADVDTKPAAQNLRQRVEGFVGRFLAAQRWTPQMNKNQLRDSLRKHINQSGMLTQGVERIIEQVVNPKIFQVIKPKIDEAVCEYLGVNMKEWKEDNARRKAELLREQQAVQQAVQQAKIQAAINEIQQKQLEKQKLAELQQQQQQLAELQQQQQQLAELQQQQQHLAELQQHQQQLMEMQQQQALASASATALTGMMPGNFNIPPPSMFKQQQQQQDGGGGGGGGGWQPGGNSFFPPSQFGSPFMNQQGFPAYMQGWEAPGTSGIDLFQQQTPGLPTSRPPLPQTFPTLTSTPTPPAPPPPSGGRVVKPPLPSSAPPIPGADIITPVPPPASMVDISKPPPGMAGGGAAAVNIGASVTLSSPDPPPPGTELALPSISLPSPMPKLDPVSAVVLHSFLSPRLLAEAMIESPQTKMSKREARRQARLQEEQQQRNRAGVFKSEAPIARNLFPAQDWERKEPRFEQVEPELEQVKAPAASASAVKNEEKKGGEVDGRGEKRPYKFAWNKEEDEGEVSDVTISSVHTSDLSSFSDADHESYKEQTSDKDTGVDVLRPSNVLEEISSNTDSDLSDFDEKPDDTPVSGPQTPPEPTTPAQTPVAQTPETKPRKLVALSYNLSDSGDEETREERKSRLAKEKEERYLKRQARRAEMEQKRKEREEEKARQREEERKKAEEAAAAMTETATATATAATATASEEEEENAATPAVAAEETKADEEQQAEEPKLSETSETDLTPGQQTPSQTVSSTAVVTTSSQDEGATTSSTPKALSTLQKKRRTKAEMKEELMQQKVEQRRAMRSRRQRTLNRRYLSEEFTSIFTENRNLAPHLGFSISDPSSSAQQHQEVVEQTVEVDTTEVQIDDGGMFIQDMEVQEECIIETETIPLPLGEESIPLDSAAQVSGIIEIASEDAGQRPAGSGLRRRSSRVSSPYSDISDESHTSRSSSSSSSSSVRCISPPPRRRRRRSSDSSDSDVVVLKGGSSSRRPRGSRGDDSVRTRQSSGPYRRSEVTESRSRTSQRYSPDDLYKPRTSHRRPLTLPSASAMHQDRDRRDSYRHGSAQPRNTRTSDPRPPSSTRGDQQKAGGMSSAASNQSDGGSSPKARPVTPSVMADLELEPVSDDNSLDNMDDDDDDDEKEEAETEVKDAAVDTKAETGSVKDGAQKTAAGSNSGQKNDAKEEGGEEGEEEERRRKSRVPIELVDFGEAARHTRGNAGGSASTSGAVGAGGSSTAGWGGNRRQEVGKAGYGNPSSSGGSHPPPPPLPSSTPPSHQSQRWVRG